jgi:alcohol dehydrogenase (cytochrome c)
MKQLWLAGVLLAAAFRAPAQVTNADLEHGPGQNWLTYVGDYYAQRHSPLTEITNKNVHHLAPTWVRHFDNPTYLETTPLVYEGVMYATSTNRVDALNAITGKEIWHYQAKNVTGSAPSRGAAIWRDRIFIETSDCHLVALARTNGAVLWDKEYATGYSCSGAPLVVKDKVIVGVAAGGRTCFISALAAFTGEELWRFWSVPRKGEPGSDSWGSFPLEWGSAPTWTPGSFDPGLNLLYWPIGNPWPDYYGGDRPGDNLYSDCLLALDPDTGKLKWYFQFTPHDTHDWDANETPVLFDGTWQGQPRKLVLQANRNGYYYVLDRVTGKFLTGRPFVKELNWATGLDANGRPILAPNMDPNPAGIRVCPTVHGATNWWAPTLDAKLGIFYVVALEKCEVYYSSPQKPVPNSGFRGTGHTESDMMKTSSLPGEGGEFYLRALDAVSGKLLWEYPMPGPTTMWAGTVSTAGGVVFTADDDGDLVALDSKTGKDLWHFYMGERNHASPMTFGVGLKQYVTIADGSNLFTFGLLE